MLGLWVHCVLGKTKYSFWLVSVTTFVTRTAAFLLACLLAHLIMFPAGTFLLHCVPSENTQTGTDIDHCSNISSCFQTLAKNKTQKVQVCGETEKDLLLSISAIGVIMLGIFSIAGTYFLYRMSDYEHLFNVSKTLLLDV